MVVTTIGPANIATSVSIFSEAAVGRMIAASHLGAIRSRLACLADCGLTNRTRRKQFGLLVQTVRFFGETLL
jgi:hypothetical protein